MQITHEQFKQRALEKFGYRFMYLEEYEGINIAMLMLCGLHGEFRQKPGVHLLSENGCPKCANKNIGNKLRKTNETFIDEVEEKFGKGIYDFANTKYVNAKSKLEVGCLICGNVTIKIAEKFLKSGCKTCAIRRAAEKKTKYLDDGSRKYNRPAKGIPRVPFSEYYKDVKKTHGEDRYDYNEDTYQGMNHKIEITCLICGLIFWQNASQHKLGQNCPDCAKEKINKKLTKSFAQYKKESDMFHGEGVFDIDESTYVNSRSMLDITCLVCGENFQQVAYSHLRNGCPECSRLEGIEKLTMTQEELYLE